MKRSGWVLACLLAVVLPAQASDDIHDQFNWLYLKPDHRANWWIANWGSDSGQQGRVEDFCGPASCILPVKEGGDHFVRLSLTPDAESGFFVNADLAELHSGFPSEGVGRWTPAPGRPVVLEAQLRWSANYQPDGSGGAVGTNGIWLWNSPFNFEDPSASDLNDAIGLNWTTDTALGGFLTGLKVTVVDQNFPVYFNQPSQPVDMQSWVTFMLEWSEDSAGVQSVRFWLNGEDLGGAVLPRRLTNLSVENWNDNEDPQFDAEGNLVINFADIPGPQYFDINYIFVTQS